MKRNNLTHERLRELLHYDPETGVFTWIVRRGHVPAGTVAGLRSDKWYVSITIDGYVHRAHRLAWLYVHGRWPEQKIDHKNGVRSDNRLCNLRDVSSLFNSQNIVSAQSHSITGIRGVSIHATSRLKYRARIKVGSVHICKHFSTLDEAENFYLETRKEKHVGFVKERMDGGVF